MTSRFYRFSFGDAGWFRVSLFETDVYCTSDPPMEDELRRAIKLYYAMMGWDENGIPTEERLHELDISWAIEKLPKR